MCVADCAAKHLLTNVHTSNRCESAFLHECVSMSRCGSLPVYAHTPHTILFNSVKNKFEHGDIRYQLQQAVDEKCLHAWRSSIEQSSLVNMNLAKTIRYQIITNKYFLTKPFYIINILVQKII